MASFPDGTIAARRKLAKDYARSSEPSFTVSKDEMPPGGVGGRRFHSRGGGGRAPGGWRSQSSRWPILRVHRCRKSGHESQPFLRKGNV